MKNRGRNLLVTLLLVVSGLVGVPLQHADALTIQTQQPCGQSTSAHYDHVVWIMLENVGYSVVGSSSAPYLNGLASKCGLATDYRAISHPSLPNYIALTSGSTQGITDDGEPSTHVLRAPSIFSELGSNWRTYAESMPTSCDRVTGGQYAARHNPAVYYLPITASCEKNDVPLTLPLNLSSAFTMIVPNICDDMHSCPVSTGDAWLSRYVPLILASAQYQSGSLALFITFDENDNDAINQVPTVVVAPSVPSGTKVNAALNHYALLRCTETLLHIGFLGASKSAAPMIGSFHL
jgi:hypothetical protein